MDMSFKKFLEEKDGGFLSKIDQELGIPPETYKKHIFVVPDYRKNGSGHNIVPLKIKSLSYQNEPGSDKRVLSAKIRTMADDDGNPMTRRFVRSKKGWRDLGRTGENDDALLPVKLLNKALTIGMGGATGSPPGMGGSPFM